MVGVSRCFPIDFTWQLCKCMSIVLILLFYSCRNVVIFFFFFSKTADHDQIMLVIYIRYLFADLFSTVRRNWRKRTIKLYIFVSYPAVFRANKLSRPYLMIVKAKLYRKLSRLLSIVQFSRLKSEHRERTTEQEKYGGDRSRHRPKLRFPLRWIVKKRNKIHALTLIIISESDNSPSPDLKHPYDCWLVTPTGLGVARNG